MIFCDENILIKDENPFLRVSAISKVGDRSEQQDSFGYSLSRGGGLFVICDGMGGHIDGALASRLSVNRFLNRYEKQNYRSSEGEFLVETTKIAYREVFELHKGAEHTRSAGSTLASVVITPGELNVCSVGDSRVYLIRDGRIIQITKDHSYHNYLVEKLDKGLIDRNTFDIENIRGNSLVSYLGKGDLDEKDLFCDSYQLVFGDKIILMSDGLYKMLSDAEMAHIICSQKNVADSLAILDAKAEANKVYLKAKRDNITAILIEVL